VFRRRLDPRWVRAGVVVALLTVATGTFARWVVTSEHAADSRREAVLTAAREQAASPVALRPALDDESAKAAANSALTVARDVFARTGSFEEAATAVLAAEVPELIFVDGPSTAPAIVSVDASAGSWTAAVMGDTGTCFWVKATAAGLIRYGTGSGCTGAEAMAAAGTSW
jgi:hypothetical protein